jgi:hypothetical protein
LIAAGFGFAFGQAIGALTESVKIDPVIRAEPENQGPQIEISILLLLADKSLQDGNLIGRISLLAIQQAVVGLPNQTTKSRN